LLNPFAKFFRCHDIRIEALAGKQISQFNNSLQNSIKVYKTHLSESIELLLQAYTVPNGGDAKLFLHDPFSEIEEVESGDALLQNHGAIFLPRKGISKREMEKDLRDCTVRHGMYYHTCISRLFSHIETCSLVQSLSCAGRFAVTGFF
tara:strand:+ start:274 stop:717 length:444 start_codon:yes stop_codon:yes gene_type:complete